MSADVRKMPRRIQFTGDREASYIDLQALRRRRLIDATTYEASINDLVRQQTAANRKAERAREKREQQRLRREAEEEARKRAEEEAKEKARKERRRIQQQQRRQRKREEKVASRRAVESAINYPVLGRELIGALADHATSGFIYDWVVNIPIKKFSIRCEYGDRTNPQTLTIEKKNNSDNETWWSIEGNFWKIIKNSDETIFYPNRGEKPYKLTASMTLIIPEEIRGVTRVQRMRSGKEHCIFAPLQKFYSDKLENIKGNNHKRLLIAYIKRCEELAVKYNEGITEQQLEEETATMNITIYIYRVDRQLKTILNPRKKWSFSFLNTSFNHCEVYLTDDNAVELTPLQMGVFFNELKNGDSPFSYEGSHSVIQTIETVGTKYRLKTPFEDIFKEFDEKINRQFLKIDYIKERSLFEYIQQAIKHNTHMSFRPIDDINKLTEIDCTKGYTQFKEAPFYQGFLGCVWDYCDKGETGEPLTVEDLKKHIGIYTIRITYMKPLLQKIFYQVGETYTLTSPMIIYLISEGDIRADILYGVYGSKLDFDFPKEFLQKYYGEIGVLDDEIGVPLYSIWTGRTASISDHRVIRRRIDYRLAQELKEAGENILWEYDDCCYELKRGEDNQWERTLREDVKYMESPPGCTVQYIPKSSSTNCPQIYAFITDYMRMNMIHEMKKIPLNDIYAWKVDSIVFKKGNYSFRPMFRDIRKKKMNQIKVNFKMSNYIFKPSSCPELVGRRIVDTMTLFAGGGGSGKSHYAATIRNLLYVAPMWSMCVDYKTKYENQYVLTPHQVLGTKGAREFFESTAWRPGTIYVDEGTMIDNYIYQKIINSKQAQHIRLIFGGDFDDLNRPFQTIYENMMDPSKLKRLNFNEDYRSEKGDPLIEIKKQIRKFMYDNYGDVSALVAFVKELLKDRIIERDTVKDIYEIEDWILTGTNESVKKWTELLQEVGEKYLVTEHSSKDVAKAMNGEDVQLNGDIIYYDNGRCELRHAFTIHSAQGKTIRNKVIIDMERMEFDYCLLYTAISRARKLEQIYLVN